MLTAKQQRFVEEYLVDLNATAAAIRSGYSEHTAKQQGSRLLTNVDVAAAVARARTKLSERAEVTAAWVIEKQRELYLSAKAENTAPGFNVAARVLRDIGEHLGMYTEKVEHSGAIGLPAAEREARVLSLLKTAKDRQTA